MYSANPNTNGKFRLMAEINMIPFIDVALVLLIIFMVMTPFLVRLQERDARVSPPASRYTRPITDTLQEIVVNVTRDGQFIVGGRPCNLDEVDAVIQNSAAGNPDQAVVVRGDRGSLLQYAVAILDICEKNRIQRTYLTTRPSDR